MKKIAITDWSYKIMRHSIKGIESSYSNYWDVLAELLQNSVVAVNKTDRKGIIEITIDCRNSSIEVKDNGCGIDGAVLGDLLKPFSTNKDADPDSIGEKGVGLKFAYFQSNKFTITTFYNGIMSTGIIKDARVWKNSEEDTDLNFEMSEEEKMVMGL